MPIAVGERLPPARFVRLGEKGPEQVELASLTAGRKIIMFAVPGAYTPTCHSAHVPSFIRTRSAFGEKGVDGVYCISVNDPFVMKAWGEATGATAAGIEMLADPDAVFTRAIGMAFDAPAAGLYSRSRRYAMLVEDGVVRLLHVEDSPGACTVSAGEALLQAMVAAGE